MIQISKLPHCGSKDCRHLVISHGPTGCEVLLSPAGNYGPGAEMRMFRCACLMVQEING